MPSRIAGYASFLDVHPVRFAVLVYQVYRVLTNGELYRAIESGSFFRFNCAGKQTTDGGVCDEKLTIELNRILYKRVVPRSLNLLPCNLLQPLKHLLGIDDVGI